MQNMLTIQTNMLQSWKFSWKGIAFNVNIKKKKEFKYIVGVRLFFFFSLYHYQRLPREPHLTSGDQKKVFLFWHSDPSGSTLNFV